LKNNHSYISFCRKKIILLSLFSFVLFFSCGGGKKEPTTEELAKNRETLIRINKYLVKEDDDLIRKYLKRRNWQMKSTETGLWYMIYEKGDGKPAQRNKLATINYKVWLLDGTLCYSSEKSGPKKFRIGKGGVESGLEEGILFLHEGDKARMIMPPHLAQGLVGDQDKIPPRSIILYELELLKLSD
jgi:FKBP-type peptidyl-prolyl cis-trans isomerase FkpA